MGSYRVNRDVTLRSQTVVTTTSASKSTNVLAVFLCNDTDLSNTFYVLDLRAKIKTFEFIIK